jgi:hypothetical protein
MASIAFSGCMQVSSSNDARSSIAGLQPIHATLERQ